MSGVSGQESWDRCRQACERLLSQLDWQALGSIYFHWGGERFWAERRPLVVERGMEWARALLGRLPARGTSLYAGAGVAELPVLLAETMLRSRTVRAVNARRSEVAVLDAGLQRARLHEHVRFEAGDAGAIAAAAPGTFDHLACVSLFSDPETFPVLSDVAYGRVAPVQLDVARFVQERERAVALCRQLVAGLRRPGWITTTVEEVPWFLAAIDAAGGKYETDKELVATAVVGDPIGFLRVG